MDGTWEQIEDKFLLSAGTSYTAGNIGGEATHLLTEDEMPTHLHTLGAHNHTTSGHTHTFAGTTSSNGAHTHAIYYKSDNTTGNSAHRLGTTDNYTGTQNAMKAAGAHTHSISGVTGTGGIGTTGKTSLQTYAAGGG